jgi:guanine deaminase
MATVGGARALDLNAGQISVGYVFDAIRVSTQQASHDLNIYADLDSKQDVFEKIIAYTDKNNITQVWVNGRTVREI